MTRIVHFELPVDEPDRAVAFYRDALGWEIAGWGGASYWLATTGPADEPGVNGALISRGDLHRSPVVIAAVDDLDGSLVKIEKAGGAVLQGRLPVPGLGWSAYVRDTEGNVLGLIQEDPSAGT